ncbi:hypothetical protein [Aquamicrobium sp. LC103]|uniref:hypothetical protein n=1 Tax=Aquamicrobium sp. LC103 TaxID=1120658 RepID=UPI00069B3149|nr:hypothetical protein [Aquamicrobium sp. LC103]TKT77610.1 nucleoside kinase [Aquamicrobium sp. LC103]
MSGGLIVHLNGWPGVGKQTVGRILAEKLGARFIHNHLLHDVAIACAGIEDAARWPLYEAVCKAAYDTLADRPRLETFVMTNALCAGSRRERQAWDHVVDLAARRNVPLVPVVMEASFEENARRLGSPRRVGRKLGDPALLSEFMKSDRIQEPDVPELLKLDVTRLSADQAAEKICDHLSALSRSRLEPASAKHRRFKQ